MNPNKICFIYSVNDERQFSESARYIQDLEIPDGYEIDMIKITDEKCMTSGYNKAMRQSDAKYKIYLNQDVLLINKSVLHEMIGLFQAHSELGMIGVTGCKTLPASGIWQDSKEKYGMVYGTWNGKMELIRFQNPASDYESVAAVDGLLLATQYDISWREEFQERHFYDISQCMEFRKSGYQVGVPKQEKIWCLHDCGIGFEHGFHENRQLFLSLYGDYLEGGIVGIEQNDVVFTGERIVINKEVKQNFNQVLEEHMHRYEFACNYVHGKMVLDAACGTGYGTKMMADAGAIFVTGVDISEESIKSATPYYKGANNEFLLGDVTNLPFPDASYDVVVSFETIEHIPDGSVWARESARVLNEGGLFIVSTPNRHVTNPGTFFDEKPLNPHHQFEYAVTEFIGELLQHYEIIELYGQTFIDDSKLISTQLFRQARKMEPADGRRKITLQTSDLDSFAEIKDAQPMYVIAVCRKK